MSVYVHALKLLAPRDHFRAELAAKLARRDYEQEEIESALDRLELEGLVDDRQAAARFVRRKLRGEPMGRRRLEAELRRKGVASGVVHATLDAEVADDERPLAREAADRWLGRQRPDRTKLARYLERRGFSPPDIIAVLPMSDTVEG